jgi:hypothetical protein
LNNDWSGYIIALSKIMLKVLLLLLFIFGTLHDSSANEWLYLDNGQLRLGVNKTSGACIGYLARSDTQQNVLNHYDQGRFVQQSYYGDEDGSRWVEKPWRYNPVQGGNYRGEDAVVQELHTDKSTMYAKVTPRNWAGGQLLPEVVMEQWIKLQGPLAHVRFKMTYHGDKTHAPRHQEIPAIFVQPELKTLIAYDGARPWTNDTLTRKVPGWPNQSQKLTENWVAYINDQNCGVGAYVPIASEATCYRFEGGGNSNCSYVAPLTTFALTPGKEFEYDFYLTLGSVEEIRSRFKQLHQERHKPQKVIAPAK